MLLLKDNRQTEEIIVHRTDEDEHEHTRGIRCPHCRWRPSESDRWQCECAFTPEPPFNSCGTSWNTFETRGRCPGCDHQWKWTSCIRCHKWSLHEAWYEPPPDKR